MKNTFCLCLMLASASLLDAQNDSTAQKSWTFSGYVEAFYSYHLNRPANSDCPDFLYSHNRHNEVAVNLGFFKTAYSKGRVRGNFALMAGTYTNDNLAAEPATLQHVLEANAGVKLSKKSDLWLDLGVFPSHIGFESAIGKDCWALSRSLAAENSPYYESGAKLSWTSRNGELLLGLLALNGWQTIARNDQNTLPLASGTQIYWKPTSRLTLNSSTYFGQQNENPTGDIWRIFSNWYAQWAATDDFGLTFNVDRGYQFIPERGRESASGWLALQVLGRYAISEKYAFCARAEYFDDPEEVIVNYGLGASGFDCLGFSANFDVNLNENALWRVEARLLRCGEEVFVKKDGSSKTAPMLTTALAISF